MSLIKCPECGKEISDKATECPSCGCPSSEWENKNFQQNETGSVLTINGTQFDILEIQKKAFIQTVANITKKVIKLCQCGQEEAESAVYGYFLSTHGESLSGQALSERISHIKSWNGKKLYCPYCLSRNIDVRETVHESISKGKSEVRKKSAITRAGNKAGRAGMIMMTGGLWALTPKKSKYNEVSQGKAEYHTTISKICMDCGRNI